LHAPAQPSSQPPRRRRHLTPEERAAIAQERAQGVQVQELARRWGVSRQAIHATLRRLSDDASGDASTVGQGETRDGAQAGARTGARAGPAPLARRSPTLSARARTEEIEELDAAAVRWGLSRPEVLRRLVRNAGALLAPDPAGTAQLAALAAEVREAGVRLNRTTRACNEAQWRRQPIPYTAADHAQTWQTIELVFEGARQVQAWALAHRAQLDIAVEAALGGEEGGGGRRHGADDRELGTTKSEP
jgi:transposase-like protein